MTRAVSDAVSDEANTSAPTCGADGSQFAASKLVAGGQGDEDARRQAAEALRRLDKSGYAALGQLKCETGDGVLVLEGRVSSFYLKQLAQTMVRQIRGITDIVNNVRVE